LYFDPDGKEPLPANLRQFFDAFFMGDFSKIDIQTGFLGRKVTDIADADGLTFGNVIFLSPYGAQQYHKKSDSGIELIAEELAHTQQFQDLGMDSFLKIYIGSYFAGRASGESHDSSYNNILFEKTAKFMALEVMKFLDRYPKIRKKLDDGEMLNDKDINQIFKWKIDEGRRIRGENEEREDSGSNQHQHLWQPWNSQAFD
jgi:hypothetical protein